MANILDFLYVIFNEIRSYFVPEKVTYKITGECKNAVNAAIICTATIHIRKKNSK